MSRVPDILVVGGGVIGLSCAWRLAQAGVTVALLERDVCGAGASGASLGALIPPAATRNGAAQRLQNESLRMYPTFAAQLQDASGIDVGYRLCGRIEVLSESMQKASTDAAIRAADERWNDFVEPPAQQLVSGAQLAKTLPHVSGGGLSALQCRVSAIVRADRLIEALCVACERAGVRIETGQKVTSIDTDGPDVTVRLGSQERRTGRVLVAAGAWASQLSPLLNKFAPVEPVCGQALVLDSVPAAVECIVKKSRVYVVPASGRSVLVGSTTEPDAGFAVRPTAAGIGRLATGAMELIPALADSAVARVWAGLRPQPKARRPYIGQVPGTERLFVATGHYKTGIGSAPMTARMICDAVEGRDTLLNLSDYAPVAASGDS